MIRPIQLSLTALLVCVCMAAVASAECLEAYDPEERGSHESAVASIASPREGTAFIIDRERGILVTAGHVVENATSATGDFHSLSHRFEMSVFANYKNEGIDIALLKVDIDGLPHLSTRQALQLSYEPLDQNPVSVLSTSRSRPIVIRHRSDSYVVESNRKIYVTVPVGGGDSGAPVISDYEGLVVGVVFGNKGPDFAVAVPASIVHSVLEKYGGGPITMLAEPLMKEIGDRLEDPSIYWVSGKQVGSCCTMQIGVRRFGSITFSVSGSTMSWVYHTEIYDGRVDWRTEVRTKVFGRMLTIPVKHHEVFDGRIDVRAVTRLRMEDGFRIRPVTVFRLIYVDEPDGEILEAQVDVSVEVMDLVRNHMCTIAGEIDRSLEGLINSDAMVARRRAKWEEASSAIVGPSGIKLIVGTEG